MNRCLLHALAASRLLAAAFLAFASAPAAAADVAQLACPVDALNGTQLEQLADHVRRQAPASEPAMQALFRTVDACRGRHRWSIDAARTAVIYNLAVIGEREARGTLEQRGIDVASIERDILADHGLIEAARTPQNSGPFEAFFARLDSRLRRRLETEPRGGDSAELLGTYVLFRATIETTRADFAGQ